VTTAVLLFFLLLWPAAGAASGLESYFGAYVGYAEVEDLDEQKRETREIDVVIRPYRRHGFQIHAVNVSLVRGRRDLPGVVRRERRVAFLPSSTGSYFVEAPVYDPFREREERAAVEGRPLRWAVLDESGLYEYSFQVLEDGRFELQIFRRWPERDGLGLEFQRIVDGKVEKRIRGHAVRAAP